MRSHRYLLSVVGTVAVVAGGAGAAAAASGAKTTAPSKPAAPRIHSGHRFAPRSGGNCPNMGSAQGTAGPAVPSSGSI
jgi:hypothetical protein